MPAASAAVPGPCLVSCIRPATAERVQKEPQPLAGKLRGHRGPHGPPPPLAAV